MNVDEAAKLKLFIIMSGKMAQCRCFDLQNEIRMFKCLDISVFFLAE